MVYDDQRKIFADNIVDSDPHFFINGYNFKVSTDAEAKSELNLVKNKMYVAGKQWGYTDIQWTNFTGETIDVDIYSRATDIYTGEKAQPNNGGISDFYNVDRTPHAVLKYWAQTFVPCKIVTNIQAFESATYVIDEISQKSPHHNFIVTKVSFIQYEKYGEIEQTYWEPAALKETININAQTYAIRDMSEHTQYCFCTKDTPSDECTASYNPEVEYIQELLQQWGFFPSYVRSVGKIQVNGRYCYYTTLALQKFQESRGIEVTGDFDMMTKSHFMRKLEGM